MTEVGKTFYQTLQNAFLLVERRIDEGDARISIQIGRDYKGNEEIQLTLYKGYGSGSVSVEGKDLGKVVEEFNRRILFKKEQENLQLTQSKTVEGEKREEV